MSVKKYRNTYDQNLLLRPSAGLTNYRQGSKAAAEACQRDESHHHHQRAMEAGTAPPPGGADGGAPSGGAPAASRKRKAAPEEHWSKKLKGQAFVLTVENVAPTGRPGDKVSVEVALRRTRVPGVRGARWVGGGVGGCGACLCGSSGKAVSESAEKCIFSFGSRPLAG